MLVSGMSAGIAAAGTYNIRPAVGEAWVIYEVGSEEPFSGNIPDLSYGIVDGALTLAQIVQDPTVAADKGNRPKEIYITRDNYLEVTNEVAANPCFISFTGERVNPNNVITDMVTCPNGAAGTVDIQPPAGETWRITEIGAELYNGGNNHPEVSIGITDGTAVDSIIIQEVADRGQQKALDWIIDEDIYLHVINSAAADVDIAYCGVRVPLVSIGSIQDVAGSAVLDIRPPAGEEWVITEIAVETWAGAGANIIPHVTVSLNDDTNISTLLEHSVVSLGWNRKFHIHIDHDTYLSITEVSTADNEVGVLGYLKRSYS